MSTMEGLLHQLHPGVIGWKTALKRLLIVLMVVLTTLSVVMYILEWLGIAGAVLLMVFGLVTAIMPRRIMLWYQYRGAMIEIGFTVALWFLLGKSMAISATLMIIVGNVLVTILRKINLACKYGSWLDEPWDNNTLYEFICMTRRGSSLLGDGKGAPLREDFVYEEEEEGYAGWRYLWWTLRNPGSPFDYFNRHMALSEPPRKGWFERKAVWTVRKELWAMEVARQQHHASVESQKESIRAAITTLAEKLAGATGPEWKTTFSAIQALNNQLEGLS